SGLPAAAAAPRPADRPVPLPPKSPECRAAGSVPTGQRQQAVVVGCEPKSLFHACQQKEIVMDLPRPGCSATPRSDSLVLLPSRPDTVRRSCRAGPGLDKPITTSIVPHIVKEQRRKIKAQPGDRVKSELDTIALPSLTHPW